MSTKLIRGLYNNSFPQKGCVLTIGNFDGIHLGHQALIKRIKASAQELAISSMVMTFEPQPLEYFAAEHPVPRLTRFREKFSLLSASGVDQVCVVRFNAKIAALTAEEFIKKILCETLHVKHLIVGKDFRFGYQRQGDINMLRAAGALFNFTVEIMPDVILAGERVSSTRVRKALGENNLALAEGLLGRPYSMMGKVVYGNQLGRQLGFPTANIYLHRIATPVHGIYVVGVYGLKKKPVKGVANVGTRPTVDGTRILLEVYLFNFKQMIYGKEVTVEFYEKLREEERYANLELLKDQMKKDAKLAKEYFKQHAN
ncbi:MAG: bifunctional riboflavin kinase/FAD synthetase [Gammaproteobacteria bacterium]|nr:bifunctional riboflavin kinase/FAD synthetase [Gammaproteobacteria bacterium]